MDVFNLYATLEQKKAQLGIHTEQHIKLLVVVGFVSTIVLPKGKFDVITEKRKIQQTIRRMIHEKLRIELR